MLSKNLSKVEEELFSIKKLIDLHEFSPALTLLQNLEAHLNESELAEHSNLMLKILSHYKKMKELEQEPEDTLELASLYLNFHRFAEAYKLFLNLYQAGNQGNLVIYGLAKTLFELGEEYHFLIDSLEKITDLNKVEQYKVHDILASFYLNKDENKALMHLNKQLELNPEDPGLNLKAAALVFKQTRSILSAEQYIQFAIKIQGRERYTALYLAIMLAEVKKDPQISIWTKELISSFPGSELSYLFYSQDLCTYDIDHSIHILQEALTKYPRSKIAHDNLIMNCQYSENISNQENLKFAQNYYQNYILPLLDSENLEFDFTRHTNKSHNELKIGFVSGDFRLHPVFFWVNSLFQNYSKKEFRIFCYANNSENEYAEILRRQIYKLEYVELLSDKELALKIYEDEIDILIDLSGHTASNRLEVFSLKPAPLQITWLGQSGPMGLPQIDYALTDRFLIKENEDEFHTEKIYRLKGCFAPYPAKDYDKFRINEKLAEEDGSIILASLNHAMKINQSVFETWAEILNRTPQSRLLLKNHLALDTLYQKRIYEIFAKHNVAKDRLIFENISSKEDYLKRLTKIDISLDTFPFGGNTTTHETLMMSVPVISLAGKRVAHRSGESILNNAGLSELISSDRSDYINKAVDLINNPQKITDYKKRIRKQYLNSPAADIEGFSEEFFQVLKQLFTEKLQSLITSNK